MANSNGWGDGAANNSIGWGQGANNAIAWGDSHAKSWAGATDIVGLTTDPAASAYFAATGITGATQQAAIDNLVKGLKADGIWSKMKAVYPFVTDNRNLWSYTNDVTAGNWVKSGFTVASNSTTAPDGTATADTLTENTSGGNHYISNAASAIALSNGNWTMSIYVKKIVRDWFVLSLFDGTTGRNAWFNINTGVVGTVQSGATASISDAGNGWYRCSITMPMSASNINYTAYYGADADNSVVYTGNGVASYYVWGAQLELGSTATDYQPIATTQQAYIASQFKYNLVNPVDSDAAFRLVFNGGWTHSSNGATPNGTNGYADTKLNDSSLTPNSSHISYYSRTNVSPTNTYEIGLYNGTKGIWFALRNSSLGSVFTGGIFQTGASGEVSVSNLDSTGFYLGGKNGSTTVKFYKNGTSVASAAKADTTATNTSIYLASLNQNGTPAFGFSTKQCAFSTIGDGLTDTEASNLYTRVQAYQTALSRQV
jgi:hypothetical protein